LSFQFPENNEYYNSSSMEISWAGSDEFSGISRYDLKLDSDEPFDVGLNTTYYLEDIFEGKHDISVIGYDLLNNSLEEKIEFSIDTVSPQIIILEPSLEGPIPYDKVTIEWEAIENGSGLDHYEISIDGEQFTDIGKTSLKTYDRLTEGDHSVVIKAFDNVGNIGKILIELTVDLNNPIINILEPPDGFLSNRSSMVIRWEGWDVGTNISNFGITLDGSSEKNVGVANHYEFRDLLEGDHVIRVYAYDMMGNVAVDEIEFTIDITKPYIISKSPTGEDVEVNSQIEIMFSEEMREAEIGILGIEGRIQFNDQKLIFTPIKEFDYDAEYVVRISGSDLAGNHLIDTGWNFNTTNMGLMTVKFVDEHGYPIYNVTIEVDSDFVGRTGKDGTFELRLRQGLHFLNASHPLFMDERMEFNVTAGVTKHIGEVPLEKEAMKRSSSIKTALIWIIVIVLILAVAITSLAIILTRRRVPASLHIDMPTREYFHVRRELLREIDINSTDCYQILGVEKDASETEIRRGYRKVAIKHHPDRTALSMNGDNADTSDEMVKVNFAKEILLDPNRKAIHDMLLEMRKR